MTKNPIIIIRLSNEEEQMANEAGKARQARRKKAGVARDKYTFLANPTMGHIEGVLGEIVLAKAANLEWHETTYTKDEADLADVLEARLRTRHWYELLILPTDKDDRLYFHITKEMGDPDYQMHGFIFGHEGKKREYWKQVTDNAPTFFVPHENLHSIEIFLEELSKDGNYTRSARPEILFPDGTPREACC